MLLIDGVPERVPEHLQQRILQEAQFPSAQTAPPPRVEETQEEV